MVAAKSANHDRSAAELTTFPYGHLSCTMPAVSALPPKVVVIAGPNGAGKSTLAPWLLRNELGILDYVNADTIARGLSAFSPESASFAAGRVMIQQLRNLAEHGNSFAFETTLATRSYAPWLAELQQSGYVVEIIYLWIRSSELAIERVEQRVRSGGHAVEPDVIRRRFERGRKNLIELYSPVADQWVVFDNSTGRVPVLVCCGGRDQDLDVRDPESWARFCGAQA